MQTQRLLALFLALAVPAFTFADEKADVDADSLTRVTKDIRYLASDALEGRGVQTKGIVVAADYLRDEFKKAGLKSGTPDGSYFQYFDVPIREKVDSSETWLKITAAGSEAVSLKAGEDFQPQQAGGPGAANGEIVFAGYGISAPDLGYDDYAGTDVKGKIVLIVRREPQQQDKDSKFNGTETTEHSYIATKLRAARENGAAGVLLVNDRLTAPTAEQDELSQPSGFGAASRDQMIPFAHIARAQADRLLKASPVVAGDKKLDNLAAIEEHIDESFKPVSQPLADASAELSSSFKTKSVKAWNVIGVIEGEGPLADETVVIGAHYDHLGFGGYGSRRRGSTEVHNGADDNATGTAAVLELARRFASAEKKPARRMVFIGFSGEERGLIGSLYYAENPTYPLDKTIAMLNFDMIGNLRNNRATLGGTATGSGLEAVAKAAAAAVPVDVNIQGGVSGGSDHLSFIRKRVPVMFCNTGLTDLYHTPEDDFETINLTGAVKVIDFCEELLKGVVAMEERPGFLQMQRTRRRPRTYLGVRTTSPEDDEVKGTLVQAVTAGSPAANAGLKVGDLIQKVGDTEIKEMRDLFTALSGKKPGDKVTVSIVRDGDAKEIEVELAAPQRRRPANN